MSDPTRLVHSPDAPDALVEALRLAKTQAPAAASVDAIARGVLQGIGFPAPPGGAPPPAPGGSAPATVGTTSALVKGGTVVAAVAITAGAFVLMQDAREPDVAPAETPAETTVEHTTASPPAPSAVRERPARATTSAAPPLEKAPPPSETALLDAAQRALGSDPSAALRHCTEHAKHYPGGALAQEREVIAIDALMRLGRTAEAKARAERFRQQHPSSGHVRRIDVLVGND